MTGPAGTITVTDSPAPDVAFPWVDAPALSVVIVTFGTGLVLDRCLASLQRSMEADSLDLEVVVVDNRHPRRGSWVADRLCLTTSGVRLLRADANLGFGGGCAAGISAARADLICLANPDVAFAPGQLARLVDIARGNPGRIIAPGLLNEDGTTQELGQRIRADGWTSPVLPGDDVQHDYASAACWLLSRDLFESVGGFDPAYHPAYYEDVDFVLRAEQLGYELVVVDDVRVVHTQHGSSGQEPDVERQRAVFRERWADHLAAR